MPLTIYSRACPERIYVFKYSISMSHTAFTAGSFKSYDPSLARKLMCLFLNTTLDNHFLPRPRQRWMAKTYVHVLVLSLPDLQKRCKQKQSSTVPVALPWRPIPVPPWTSTSPIITYTTRSTSHAHVRPLRPYFTIIVPEPVIHWCWNVSSSVVLFSAWRQIVVSPWRSSTVAIQSVRVVRDVGVNLCVLQRLRYSEPDWRRRASVSPLAS